MLYHLSLPIPRPILSQVRQSGLVRPTYSKHASQRASQYSINLPRIIDYSSCVPFEIECTSDGRVIKVGYRTRYKGELNGGLNAGINADKMVGKSPDKKLDLILVVNARDNFVRTVWLNRVSDQHKSLDISRYANAQQIAS